MHNIQFYFVLLLGTEKLESVKICHWNKTRCTAMPHTYRYKDALLHI